MDEERGAFGHVPFDNICRVWKDQLRVITVLAYTLLLSALCFAVCMMCAFITREFGQFPCRLYANLIYEDVSPHNLTIFEWLTDFCNVTRYETMSKVEFTNAWHFFVEFKNKGFNHTMLG